MHWASRKLVLAPMDEYMRRGSYWDDNHIADCCATAVAAKGLGKAFTCAKGDVGRRGWTAGRGPRAEDVRVGCIG